jgi:hypothetical protein
MFKFRELAFGFLGADPPVCTLQGVCKDTVDAIACLFFASTVYLKEDILGSFIFDIYSDEINVCDLMRPLSHEINSMT